MNPLDLDITVRQGDFMLTLRCVSPAQSLALFGPSGSGKSTALEAIAGLRTPVDGRIAIAGKVFFDAAAGINLHPRLRRVGYVPQDVLLFPHLSVRRNILFGTPDGAGVLSSEILRLLELEPLLDRSVGRLSGGERQRVALARALHARPDVLLLDEPLAAIDLRRRRRIIDALRQIRDDLRVPIIVVTHMPEEAALLAEHVVFLDNGEVTAMGTASDLFPHATDAPALDSTTRGASRWVR